jgi:nucleoside-diphosphate-sugar epimerase
MHPKKIILITGSSGFIGTEVVNKLKKNKKIILYLLINKNKKKKN